MKILLLKVITTLYPTYPGNIIDFYEKTDGIYTLKEPAITNIILSSSMYSRFKDEPEKYKNQNDLYKSMDDNYKLTKQYNVVPSKKSSSIELINIFRNFDYTFKVKKLNMSGPELLFYKTN